ncbi:MAG TPA: hypothetical protein VMR17_05040, partial [Xanthobacteraceae bacterium]|nr:hypothetical protein [Xanthobacteraceae bacterium]
GGRRYVAYIVATLVILGMFVTTQPSIILDSDLAFVVRHYPKVYFWSISIMYFCVGFLFFEIFLFCIWKIFRQHWPGTILWHEEEQSTLAD